MRPDHGDERVAAAGRQRLFCLLVGAGMLGAFVVSAALAPRIATSPTGSMNVGFSFSQQQTAYLGVSERDTYQALMQLSPALVRLAVYWDRVEPEPGFYDFSAVDWLLANTPPSTRVVLALGMKAPRWPEFYIPAWLEQANGMPDGAQVSDDPQLQQAVQVFVRAVVQHYHDSPAVAYWQVENEPLDPSGPREWTVGADVLAREVALVRSLDDQHRPVLVTTFVPTNPFRQLPGFDQDLTNRVHSILAIADVVGLDVYPVRAVAMSGATVSFRLPPFIWQQQLRSIQQTARSAGKDVWITELQAEPWLATQIVYLDRLPNPEIDPSETDFVTREVRGAGFQTALLWGAEYWYMRLQRYGDDHWWSTMQPLFS